MHSLVLTLAATSLLLGVPLELFFSHDSVLLGSGSVLTDVVSEFLKMD